MNDKALHKTVGIMKTCGLFLTSWILLLNFAGCNVTPESKLPDANIPAEYIENYIDPVLGYPPEFEMAISFPDFPEKVPVYSIKYPHVTPEYIAEIAESFNIKGDIVMQDDGGGIRDSETGCHIAVYNTGAIWYHADDFTNIMLFSKELPSFEEAKQIAVDFLEDKGLLPAEVKQYIGVGWGANPHTNIIVAFNYHIGDYPVEGPGLRYMCRIGDKGIVGEVGIFYPEVEASGLINLRSPEDALADLRAGKGYWSSGKKIRIDKVSLAYYLRAAIRKQDEILPVYYFQGKEINTDGTEGDSAYALALAVNVTE